MKRGKLVVIEGIDGSGKKTQWRRLVKRLGAAGVDFPRYKTSMWGRLLIELLAGKQGDFQKSTPYLAVLPYVLDQYDWWQKRGREAMGAGKTVVANRYVTSNIHQIYKLKGGARKKFADWFWRMAYQELGLPRPDLVLVLDVPPEISYKLQVTSNKRQDRAELDQEYQVAAYRGYQDMCNRHKNWVLVKCMENNKLLTKRQISERIWEIWHEKFKAG